jgi:hypothetical protein
LKPIEIGGSNKIKEMLMKKMKMVKRDPPAITKGIVFMVSSYMYRHKPKMLLVNPFKGDIVIEND